MTSCSLFLGAYQYMPPSIFRLLKGDAGNPHFSSVFKAFGHFAYGRPMKDAVGRYTGADRKHV